MLTAFFELITITAALWFTASICISFKNCWTYGEDTAEPAWYLKASRTGSKKAGLRQLFIRRKGLRESIALSEGSCRAGNSLLDDIYIDISGQRICLYLNVQKDTLLITVLKGSIIMNNHAYHADPKHTVSVQSYGRIRSADIELIFLRRR